VHGVLENKSGNISGTRKDRGKVTMDRIASNALSNGIVPNPLWPPPSSIEIGGLQPSYPLLSQEGTGKNGLQIL